MKQHLPDKWRATWFGFLLVCVFSTLVYAAQPITGRITDEKGEGIPGVSVTIKGTNRGTTTDADGRFSLDAKPNDVLVITSVGYVKQEITVGNQTTFNYQLSPDAAALDEVVVTALGIERNVKNLTYSAQKVDGSKLTDVRDANFVNTLSGKVAGLVTTTGAGGPGGATRVVLRGNRSVNGNNNALFVLDGVPMDNSIGGQSDNDFGGYNSSDGASNINPDDIESVNVLKGAAASALYGSRAANGVIMITTKKGKVGRVSTQINSGVTMDTPMSLPMLQNEYGQGNGGTASATASGSWGAKGGTLYPNNVSAFFRNALSANNSVSVSGGSEKMMTYLSYTNNYNQGLIPNNDLKRNTINLRIGNNLTNRLSTDVRLTYVNQMVNNRVKVGEESGVVMNLYKIPRSVDLNDYKTFEDANGVPRYWTSSSIYMNPYWTINRATNDDERNRIMMLASATYKLTDWLNIMARANVDTYNDIAKFKFYNRTLLFAGNGGSYNEGFGRNRETNFDVLLSGNNSITSDLKVNYNLGGAINNRMSRYTYTNANGLLVPNKFALDYGRNVFAGTSLGERQIQSIYGTASFSYRDYLIFDATARNDWSSTLPKPHSYFYPSFGVTAILSEMMGSSLPSGISFAKVRGSWTQVGNDADPYRLQQTYGLEQGGRGGFILRDATKAIPDLKPEITTSLEFGADLRFLQNRLGLDFTWYKTNSVNQLILIDLAAPSGFSNQYINAGNIQNQGVELSLTGKLTQDSPLRWDMTLNYALNRNKIISLSEDTKLAFLGGGYGRTAGPVVKEGGSYGDLYGEGWKRDAQGRFVVNSKGLPVGTGGGGSYLGNFNPRYTLGLLNSLGYKNWNMTFLVDGRFGGVMTSGTEANLAFDGNAYYTTQNREGGLVLNAVNEKGEPNTVPITAEQLWTTVSGGRYSMGEFFTYDATNVRLREFTLGYNIPMGNATGFFKNARISMVARNLFFLYRGSSVLDIPGIGKRKMTFDPEINLGASNFQGVEYGNLPSTRSVGLNLKLGF